MSIRRAGALAVAALGLAGAACSGGSGRHAATPPAAPAAHPATVGLWGDIPYTRDDQARFPHLVASMNAADVDFSVFDGDFKGGGRCDDRVYTQAIGRFDSFDAPVVYVIGDNEWTDCHGGGQNALERLAHLRQVMFASPASFGKRTMALEHQSAQYPENTRWQAGGVVFVGVHVVGSNDDHFDDVNAPDPDPERTVADRLADNAEHDARAAADAAWLHDSFDLARRTGAAGVMVVVQADPYFEIVGPAERAAKPVDGTDAFVDALRGETVRFAKPVALVHGDSHRYRLDHPLLDRTGNPVTNLVRLETFGTPDVSWVKATVDARDPQVFHFDVQRVT
ncbi:MAG: hypothetical protein ABR511_11995 [Acidimicrobiales bacterium]